MSQQQQPNEAVEKLARVVAGYLQQQQPQASAPVAAQPVAAVGGLPAAGFPAGGFAPAAGPLPQPCGVSVPVTVPLPDGQELSVRVHFGPEAAANLQQFAAACLQMFGPYLQARNPWNSYGPSRRSYRYDSRYERR